MSFLYSGYNRSMPRIAPIIAQVIVGQTPSHLKIDRNGLFNFTLASLGITPPCNPSDKKIEHLMTREIHAIVHKSLTHYHIALSTIPSALGQTEESILEKLLNNSETHMPGRHFLSILNHCRASLSLATAILDFKNSPLLKAIPSITLGLLRNARKLLQRADFEQISLFKIRS